MSVTGGAHYSAGDGLALSSGTFSLQGILKKTLASNLAGINGTQEALSLTLPVSGKYYSFMGYFPVNGTGVTEQNFAVHSFPGTFLWVQSETISGNTQGSAGTAVLTYSTYVTSTGTVFGTGATASYSYNVVRFWGAVLTTAANQVLQIDQIDTGTTNNLAAGAWLMAVVEN